MAGEGCDCAFALFERVGDLGFGLLFVRGWFWGNGGERGVLGVGVEESLGLVRVDGQWSCPGVGCIWVGGRACDSSCLACCRSCVQPLAVAIVWLFVLCRGSSAGKISYIPDRHALM